VIVLVLKDLRYRETLGEKVGCSDMAVAPDASFPAAETMVLSEWAAVCAVV
jgi:hypothetical protein